MNASRLCVLALAAISATATGARPSDVAHAAAMTLELTVGEFDGLNSCTGTEKSLTMPVGTQVEYCYVMRNTGDHTLTMHDRASDSATVTALPVDPDLDVVAESAAMSVAMTVMVDDGTDTCGTDIAAIVEKGTSMRFCYTMTNTGDEALNLHDVWDTHIGHIAGPGFDHLVQPGDGVSLTATGVFDKSAVHGLTWEATGVESDTVVDGFDGVSITVLGPEITLDMTVMVDDGHGTCGTESELAVPVGTQVTYCYTMTDTGDEDVNYHYLDDDQLGLLLSDLDREVSPGETLLHTEVAVITEAVTSTGHWYALSQGTGTDISASDSVTVEIGDEVEPTTTTTVAAPDPCAATPAPTAPPPTDPPPTSPPTTAPPTTGPTTTLTTTTAVTTTTTTQPPSFTTTTEGLGIVLPTTSTTLGEPAGFARHRSAAATAPCDGSGSSHPGGTLPATGTAASLPVAVAVGLVAIGAMFLISVRVRRT